MGVLEQLRVVNAARKRRWHDVTEAHVPWEGVDWAVALGGEAGEALNVVKKLRRHETGLAEASAGTPPADALRMALAEELADVLIYADLLAAHYGIMLSVAVCNKFNNVSIRNNFPERLDYPDA